MGILASPDPSTTVTAFHSKILSSVSRRNTHPPLAEALNYALGCLSDIQVNGLPELKTHIAFVPYNRRVSSDSDLARSPFKPDIALMLIQDARKLYGLNQVDIPEVSRLVGEISGKSISSLTGWKTILSTVEVERRRGGPGWAPLGVFSHQDKQVIVTRDADQQLDQGPDDSQPITREINLLP